MYPYKYSKMPQTRVKSNMRTFSFARVEFPLT